MQVLLRRRKVGLHCWQVRLVAPNRAQLLVGVVGKQVPRRLS
mgnify:CR=1 FL=1